MKDYLERTYGLRWGVTLTVGMIVSIYFSFGMIMAIPLQWSNDLGRSWGWHNNPPTSYWDIVWAIFFGFITASAIRMMFEQEKNRWRPMNVAPKNVRILAYFSEVKQAYPVLIWPESPYELVLDDGDDAVQSYGEASKWRMIPEEDE